MVADDPILSRQNGPATLCKCSHRCDKHTMFDPGWCKICSDCRGFESAGIEDTINPAIDPNTVPLMAELAAHETVFEKTSFMLPWWVGVVRLFGFPVYIGLEYNIGVKEIVIQNGGVPVSRIQYRIRVWVGNTEISGNQVCPHGEDFDDCPDCRH